MSNLFVKKLQLPLEDQEIRFVLGQKRTCYNGVYPFKIFPQKALSTLTFAPITILYGGNGSGKTTLLNILAEALQLTRHSPFSGGAFFGDYVKLCKADFSVIPLQSQILTSDDVSDYLLNLRTLNDGIRQRREELLEEYTRLKWDNRPFTSLEDYDRWKETTDAKRKTSSKFVKARLTRDVDLFSNGETAMKYYTERITEHALYLIDEPENSLSAAFQTELTGFLADSARFFGCQLVIATHSPFLLSIPGAVIYDLDSLPVQVRPWTELENVRVYYEFFKNHQKAFEP